MSGKRPPIGTDQVLERYTMKSKGSWLTYKIFRTPSPLWKM